MNLLESIKGDQKSIIKQSIGMDYDDFEYEHIGFDYEGMMKSHPYSIKQIKEIQKNAKVGETPFIELKNINQLIKKLSKKGYGAKIFVKDEACNPSGSFKDRRSSVSVYDAMKKGYEGVICATSGNYGAAVASQAAMYGLKAIILQEAFDSRKVGQPEILEKARACLAYGAEVNQLTVGPELFYELLKTLRDTGFYNASLYSPLSVAGVETLGFEIAEDSKEIFNQYPDAVVVTHAGGGNVTGTARGLLKAGAAETQVIGASVDLTGLHMASDKDFNKKSFTTGHTGFGMPFSVDPDRVDVPRNAARPLRYLDRYVLVSQGEVFYTTEMLAQLEGLERGPAGNTSLAAAVSLAQEMDEDQIIVVQETEYTGAGKHPTAQLTFARQNGIEIRRGHPENNMPGKNIIIPDHPSQLKTKEVDLDKLRKSYLRRLLKTVNYSKLNQAEIEFIAAEVNQNSAFVKTLLSRNSLEH